MIRLYPMRYQTQQDRAAACIEWLLASHAAGRPATSMSTALHAAITARASDQTAVTNPRSVVGARNGWKVSEAGWQDKFNALTAASLSAHEVGTKAWQDLHTPAHESAVRLIRLGDGAQADWLASWSRPGGLHLFDPRTGLWDVPALGGQAWFATHMTAEYHNHDRASPLVAFDTPLPTPVHYTWIGPPSTDTQVVGTRTVRADIGGITLLAAEVANGVGNPIDITFHCLHRYAATFTRLLQGTGVTVRSVESQLDSRRGHQLRLTRPLLDRMDVTVDHIIRASLRHQRTSASMRDVVNVKVLWGYRTLVVHGGYHFDCGILPIEGTPFSLPAPQRFGVVTYTQPGLDDAHANKGSEARLAAINSDIAAMSGTEAVLVDDVQNMFKGFVFPVNPRPRDAATVTRARTQRLPGGRVDVWAMRSPRGDPMATRALEFYVREWFLLEHLRDELARVDEGYESACRAAVVSAALTGMAPTSMREFWGGGSAFLDRHVIHTKDQVVASLGIQKIGFRSHAPKAKKEAPD